MLLLITGLAAGPASADLPASVAHTAQARAELLAEAPGLAPGETLTLALRLTLAAGWHSYWVNPGDSGQATRIAWEVPDGVATGAIEWQRPEAIPYGPLMNYGYHGEVLHLVELELSPAWPAGQPVEIRAQARWLVCADMCIPQQADLGLTLATSGGPFVSDPQVADAFRRARALMPEDVAWAFEVEIREGEAVLRLPEEIVALEPASAYFFPAEWGVLEDAGEQSLITRDGHMFLRLPPGPKPLPRQITGVLSVSGLKGAQLGIRAFAVCAAVSESR